MYPCQWDEGLSVLGGMHIKELAQLLARLPEFFSLDEGTAEQLGAFLSEKITRSVMPFRPFRLHCEQHGSVA